MVKKHSPLLMVLIIAGLLLTAGNTWARKDAAPKTIAVIPFTLNTPTPMPHIPAGIAQMLYSRLSWRGKVVVIPNKRVKDQLTALRRARGGNKLSPVLHGGKNAPIKNAGENNRKLTAALGRALGCDFIVTGSITELAGSFSIDARVVDLKNRTYMSFFEQSQRAEELISRVDRLAAAINHKVFKRSTYTWEQMEAEKKAEQNRLKRQNPEHLLESPKPKTGDDPGWKVWKYLF